MSEGIATLRGFLCSSRSVPRFIGLFLDLGKTPGTAESQAKALAAAGI
jgi:hypothetical protein